jgi:hypothetical protein
MRAKIERMVKYARLVSHGLAHRSRPVLVNKDLLLAHAVPRPNMKRLQACQIVICVLGGRIRQPALRREDVGMGKVPCRRVRRPLVYAHGYLHAFVNQSPICYAAVLWLTSAGT